ncbi:unnamed protein product [Staurois parvus]|uniref:Uncharacterized protein n=1 Tax=Staurois parvus TaxID=386267 RepID=A0ABN9G5B4_9NEOB|nr:unnamed protein product [Staurois parvus]
MRFRCSNLPSQSCDSGVPIPSQSCDSECSNPAPNHVIQVFQSPPIMRFRCSNPLPIM